MGGVSGAGRHLTRSLLLLSLALVLAGAAEVQVLPAILSPYPRWTGRTHSLPLADEPTLLHPARTHCFPRPTLSPGSHPVQCAASPTGHLSPALAGEAGSREVLLLWPMSYST